MAGVTPLAPREAARDAFLRNLRAASAKQAPHGITLLLEPLDPFDAPGYFYVVVDEGADVVAKAGCANIKLMFDCYHVGRSGGDVVATLERLLPIIGHVQIAAVPSRAEPDIGKSTTVPSSLRSRVFPTKVGSVPSTGRQPTR